MACQCGPCTERCQELRLPGLELFELAELQRRRQALTTALFDDLQLLRELLQVHRHKLSQRMRSDEYRDRSGTLCILQDLPHCHRPQLIPLRDYHAHRQGRLGLTENVVDMPEFNVEALNKDDALLVLMMDRAQRPLYTHLHKDADDAGISIGGHESTCESEDLRMVFFGPETRTEYGRLVKKTDLARTQSHLGYEIAPAMHFLHIQQKKVSWLMAAARALLHDYNLDPTWLERLCRYSPPLCPPLRLSPQPTVRHTRLMELRATMHEQSSSANKSFQRFLTDPQYAVQSVQDRYSRCCHIPQYFIRKASELVSKHSAQTTHLSRRVGPAQNQEKLVYHVSWGLATYRTVRELHTNALFWALACRCIDSIAELLEGNARDKYCTSLPSGVAFYAYLLEMVIEQWIDHQCEAISRGVPASAEGRSLFDSEEMRRRSPMGGPREYTVYKMLPKVGIDREQERVRRTLKALVAPRTAGYESVVEETRCLLDDDSTAKEHVPEWVRDHLAQIETAMLFKSEFRSMEPFRRAWRFNEHDAVKAANLFGFNMQDINEATECLCVDLPIFADRQDWQYSSTTEPGNTSARLLQCQIEGRLERFRTRLCDTYKRSYTATFMHTQLMGIMNACKQSQSAIGREKEHLTIEPSTQTIPHGEEGPAKGRAFSKDQRPKQKSKATGSTGVLEGEPAEHVEAPDDRLIEELLLPRVFRLDRHAYATFDTIFNMSNIQQPGELSWPDFVQAMAVLGFEMVPGQGSERQFKPRDDSGWRRSIVIHQPHSPPKFVQKQIYRLRSRLGTVLGLEKTSFALEG